MAEFAGMVLVVLALVAGVLAVWAWAFMLFVGVLHGEWLTDMPTIGYWGAVKVSIPLALLAGAWRVKVS